MSAAMIIPVSPTQPRPQQQGRRRYDATDIALLIEFSNVWLETAEDSMEASDNEITSVPATTPAPQTAEAPVTMIDMTMTDPIIMAQQMEQERHHDNASVVSVESFECQDMDIQDEEEDMEKAPAVKPSTTTPQGAQREAFINTCWEIDSFMENVQVGLA